LALVAMLEGGESGLSDRSLALFEEKLAAMRRLRGVDEPDEPTLPS
jgi:hypothetical protein